MKGMMWKPVHAIVCIFLTYRPSSALGSSYSFGMGMGSNYGCEYPSAFVNRSTIDEGKPVVRSNGSDWILTYNITWDPPTPPEGVEVDWEYRVNVPQGASPISHWSSYDCVESQVKGGSDVTEPFYLVDLRFTYKSLFQVLPVHNGELASDVTSYILFETPDCYEATGDAGFCSTQDVVLAGSPHGLKLLGVTEFVGNDHSIIPTFEWYSPVQVNEALGVAFYQVTLRLSNETTGFVQSNIIRHNENQTRYTWTANGSNRYDGRLEKDMEYIFLVHPLVGSDQSDYFAELTFWMTVNITVTPSPEPSVGSIDTIISDDQSGRGLLVALIIVLFVIIIVALIFAIIARKKGFFDKEVMEEVFIRMDRPKGDEYSADSMDRVDPMLKPKEITHDKVALHEELGKGQFGIVYKGLVYDLNSDQEYVEAAVKTTKDGAFNDVKEDLLDEMKLMIQLGKHPNIMSLLACCTKREPYYLITEYMHYGDLLNFLRRCREEAYGEKDNTYNIGEMEQLAMAHQIAKGMAYVQTERFYHGDLAARNVLVGRGLTLKISDFGLADDIYSRGYKRREQEQKIPIKWCSLEAILNGICSSEGDVWSYGVVMYEIFTLGGTPYPGIAGRFLVAQLKEGFRMEQPEGCPDEIYKIMLQCWEEEAENRPRFQEISEEVDAMLVERSDYLTFDEEEDDEDSGSSRPLSIPNIYVKAPGMPHDKRPESFAPIVEEENDVGVDELQEIIKGDKDPNDNEIV